MREPTDAEYRAAQRAVARIARQVRELSGNPTVRGTLVNAFTEDGFAAFTLTSRYDIDDVLAAARQIPELSKVTLISLTVDATVPVTYPAAANPGDTLHLTVTEKWDGPTVIWTAREGRRIVARASSGRQHGMWDSSVLRAAIAAACGTGEDSVDMQTGRTSKDGARLVPHRVSVTLPAAEAAPLRKCEERDTWTSDTGGTHHGEAPEQPEAPVARYEELKVDELRRHADGYVASGRRLHAMTKRELIVGLYENDAAFSDTPEERDAARARLVAYLASIPDPDVQPLTEPKVVPATGFEPALTFYADGTTVVVTDVDDDSYRGRAYNGRTGVTYGFKPGCPSGFQAVIWEDGTRDNVAPHVLKLAKGRR